MYNEKSLTDVHIHAITTGTGPDNAKYGNIVDPKLKKSITFRIASMYHSIDLYAENADRIYIQRLDQKIGESKYVKSGIIFGMDGIYDQRGVLDTNRTSLMITNEYVYQDIKKFKNLKYAASINPQRKDALKELEKAKKQKAVLIKGLPNSQNFDPSDKKYIPFYKRMYEYKIPLLLHCGYEFAVRVENQSFGHPEKYKRALDEGVTLIGAHGCASGLVFIELYRNLIKDYLIQYPNFYLDLSATSIISRTGNLFFLQKLKEAKGRLLFGTDFPLPVFSFPFVFRLKPSDLIDFHREKNYFDKYAKLFYHLGFDFPDFASLKKTSRKPAAKTTSRVL